MNNNPMIAKLLAKENISVEHGNYRTAFFDVEKRVLGLPMWKDMGKNVYDLLIGHEVGHALFTPADGWHDSDKEIPGVPRAYINVVEDIRIEKLIQRKYPGLVRSFKLGYSALDEKDFFGIENKDIDGLHIADRINLKAKLRDLINVDFSEDEVAVVEQCFKVETWEDVLEACKALYDFVEANKEENGDEENAEVKMDFNLDDTTDGDGQDSGSSTDSQANDDDLDMASSKADGSAGEKDFDPQDEELKEQLKEIIAKEFGKSEEEPVKEVEAGPSSAGHDGHYSETHQAFRDREDDLLDMDENGRMDEVIKGITRAQLNEMLITYKEVFDQRDEFKREKEDEWKLYHGITEAIEEAGNAFVKFEAESKKFVNVMAKEFEMRKMAYRYKRAQTARSGSLDMNKLHNYKLTDDIFNRVTTLADAKSHGMIMFIDYSGSMGGVIVDVIKQTMILASFCKKVNIPFEVYSFTTGRRGDVAPTEVNHIDHDRTKVVQLLTSNMKKADYVRAYKEMFMVAHGHTYGRIPYAPVDGFGGTPLNEVIMGSRFIIRDFKAKFGIQKTNVVFLTDGDAQSMYIKSDYDNENPVRNTIIDVDGNFVRGGGRFDRGGSLTKNLLTLLGKEANIVGYFIADSNHSFRGKVWEAADKYVFDDEMKELRKKFNKQKFIQFDKAAGYDKFFILKGDKGSLDTEADEFEVSNDAKKGEIQRAFKKHAASKKSNKILATEFAKMVA